MKVELRWLNCFWLMLPLLAWNIILAPEIAAEKIISDANSPVWLLVAENLTPFLPFLGIALIGRSIRYAAVSALFIFLHN